MVLVCKLIQEMKEEYLAKQELYIGTNGDALSFDYLKGMQRLLYLADDFVTNELEQNYKCLTLEEVREMELKDDQV